MEREGDMETKSERGREILLLKKREQTGDSGMGSAGKVNSEMAREGDFV